MALILAGGCEPRPSEQATTPETAPPTPEAEATSPPPPTPEAEAAPPSMPPVTLEGWPYHEEFHSHRLTYTGNQPASLPLRAAADAESSEVAEVTVKPEQVLEVRASKVIVLEPRMVRARHRVDLGQAQAVEGEETTRLELTAGDALGVLRYEGEGTCRLYHEGKIWSGGCPSYEDFEGLADAKTSARALSPQRMEWWVQLKAEGGTVGWAVVTPDEFRHAVVEEPPG